MVNTIEAPAMHPLTKHFTLDGLDGVGKTTIKNALAEHYRVTTIDTPDQLIVPLRPYFDEMPLPIRFAYYCLGNCLASKNARQALGDYQTVVQDRSWLTTLAAHQVRGLHPAWLKTGSCLARACTTPNSAVIIEVEETVRKNRLGQRGYLRPSDKENLIFARDMNKAYFFWAKEIGWPAQRFDNTWLNLESAIQELASLLQLEKK